MDHNLGSRAPLALQPGSRVVAIAPSSPFDVAAFEVGLGVLRERYRVDHRSDLAARAGFLAGDDGRRLAELQEAIDDDSVEAIIAARGGYGATRLLDRVDLSRLARHPKQLVGFSDITALHALWAQANLRSIHGPMVATIGKDNGRETAERLFRMLEGQVPDPIRSLACMRQGKARGTLLGGNLSVLTALIGTPFMPNLFGAILFLEDIGERPYRIDRMLTTWRQAGLLGSLAGVALGAFTQCDPGADGVTVDDVFRSRLEALAVPIVTGVPAGHIDDNLPLPFGAHVEVDADAGSIQFLGGACEPRFS